MPTVEDKVNFPTRLCWFRTVLRNIDKEFNFIPYKSNEGDDILEQIPDDEKTIKKYFINIRNQTGMLRCGFCGQYKLEKRDFMNEMFQVMGDNKCFFLNMKNWVQAKFTK